jgi:replication factor A1
MELQRLNIDSLIPGMQNVELFCKVVRISKKDFSTERASGKLANVILEDGTGQIRLVLWDKEIDLLSQIKEGDFVNVSGYVRQGIFGPELRLGRSGKIIKTNRNERSRISELKEGQRAEIRAALVMLFESNPFYEICPSCKASVKEQVDGSYVCVAHGNVEPAYGLHVSGVADDGSGAIRVVAFREQAETILGVDSQRARDIVLRKGMPALFANSRFGEWIFTGHVRRNSLFDRLEFIISKISPVDPKKEIEALMEENHSIP